jgi:beta-galactosidase
MKRQIYPLVTDWLFCPTDRSQFSNPKCSEREFARVSIPHTNRELPFHNFSEKEFAFVSWYRRWFRLPQRVQGRRVLVDFDGVMLAATVFVNGKKVGPEHRGGYTPFSYDITEFLNEKGLNLLAVRVDSRERNDIPPFGRVVDYMTFGGIYREVSLRIVDELFIENIFVRPAKVLEKEKKVDTTIRVRNTSKKTQETEVFFEFQRDSRKNWKVSKKISLPPQSVSDVELTLSSLVGLKLWELDQPTLYSAKAILKNGDAVETKIGFRTVEFREDGSFYLNGKSLKLRGLNRHQTYPYIGQAGPARLQRKDADLLKDFGCNLVRTSHYPQSTHFLNRCDQIGLLVFEEIPGWNFIGDEEWKQVSLSELEAMVVRDRNHPSIILWGVRINESRDDHDFYTKTNALAHQLDPTRQTGGVRVRYESELLEDVFTMNDFQYELRPPKASRYLNTEFCGHMYPTKTFDQEERVIQHALHHAHIINTVNGMKSAGAIGWCAFDYNTHSVFGSGDRICYHGVWDMFREPKLAAFFYASQQDPKRKVILQCATYWKRGDRSGGKSDPLITLSNVEEIEVWVGDELRGRFQPAREKYPNLEHPPFIVEKLGGEWGDNWKPLKIVGLIGGKIAAVQQFASDGIPFRLEMESDDSLLMADGSDMTRVSLRITDKFGNILPFAMQPVFLNIQGPGILVGDNPFPMPGGRGAVYVRTTRKAGRITITAKTARLDPQQITIRTKAR